MTPLIRIATAAACAGLLAAKALAADLKVGFVTSLSGPVSGLGIPYDKGIRVAVALRPLIDGRKVQLIVLDDASDPSTAARNARKLVTEDQVDVLIGTSGVPGAMAIADQLDPDNPVRKVALEFRDGYQKLHGALPQDAFSAYTFDAWLLLADAAARALKTGAEPGTEAFRAGLKEASATTKELRGTHGVFGFRANDAYGLDPRSVVVIQLEKGEWKLVR